MIRKSEFKHTPHPNPLPQGAREKKESHMSDLVQLSFDTPQIARITLNDPERLNALTWEMGEAFETVIDHLCTRPDLRAVAIAGEGRAFSSGGNMEFIKENCVRNPQENERLMVQFYKKFLSVTRLPVPTLALIHGPAVGAGLALALACDIRFAAEEAKMGLNFTRLGITPGMGSSFFLPRVVGKASAYDLFYTGRLITGKEAGAIGLVERALPTAGALQQDAHTWLASVSQNAPLAIRGTRRLLTRDLDGLEQALVLEAKEQAITFASEDIREGVAAILAKRAPIFMGK